MLFNFLKKYKKRRMIFYTMKILVQKIKLLVKIIKILFKAIKK